MSTSVGLAGVRSTAPTMAGKCQDTARKRSSACLLLGVKRTPWVHCGDDANDPFRTSNATRSRATSFRHSGLAHTFMDALAGGEVGLIVARCADAVATMVKLGLSASRAWVAPSWRCQRHLLRLPFPHFVENGRQDVGIVVRPHPGAGGGGHHAPVRAQPERVEILDCSSHHGDLCWKVQGFV